MSDHIDNGLLLETTMATVTSATVLGVLHWGLGVPAAAYYALKFWRLLRKRHRAPGHE